jgi:hypothetical protein
MTDYEGVDMPDNTRTARSITRAVRPRKIAVSKITNARGLAAKACRDRLTTAILCSIIMAGVAEPCLLWRREAR